MISLQSAFDPWPLEDQSVQAIITSPPYWCLRKYDIPDIVFGGDPDCEHQFLSKKIKDGRGTKGPTLQGRKTKHRMPFTEGSCRCGAWKGQYGLEPSVDMYIEHSKLWAREAWRVLKNDGVMFVNIADTYAGSNELNSRARTGLRRKTLALIPQRFVIAMYDEGWYVRDAIVWEKPNGIPESAQDRVSRRYEMVFMFTKRAHYYFNLDGIRIPYKPDSLRRFKDGYRPQNIPEEALPGRQRPHQRKYNINPLGSNPGNVWRISVNRLPDIEHYSIFPKELVETLIKCSTRPGDHVFDPFSGSGTVGLVAANLKRKSSGLDLGYEEVRAARRSPG